MQSRLLFYAPEEQGADTPAAMARSDVQVANPSGLLSWVGERVYVEATDTNEFSAGTGRPETFSRPVESVGPVGEACDQSGDEPVLLSPRCNRQRGDIGRERVDRTHGEHSVTLDQYGS